MMHSFLGRQPTFSLAFRSSSQGILLINVGVTTKFISTSSGQGHAKGLKDSADPLSLENSRVGSAPYEEFTFLCDSLMNHGANVQDIGTDKCSNVALAIANEILTSHDGLGDETQKVLRQYRGQLNQSLVIDVLKLMKNPGLGLKFFAWAGKQIGYCHSMPVYDALLEMIESRDSDNRIPDCFLDEMKDADQEVLGKLLNTVVQKYCRNGMWNAALQELGKLKDLGCRPSRSTYSALVQVFVGAKRLDTAALVHKEMLSFGYHMDEYTLGCFVRSLCASGKWSEALKLIEIEDFVPDTVLYTNMISGLCEAGLFEEAMCFLDKMRANACLPNVVTYRILLSGCLRKMKLGRCKRILKMMITEGCYPNPRIFNSLVSAFCRSGEYSYAHKLLDKMSKCGCRPNYVTYNILIGGICGIDSPKMDSLKLAEMAYDEMLGLGIVLNKINVSNFARCLCGIGKFEKAYNVIFELMSKGFVPDTATCTNVIGHLCGVSEVEKAFLLFKEMKRNKIAPDTYTYTILIDRFCKAGLIEQARRWFDEMEGDGCTPNVVTCTALVHGYLKAKMISNANEVFEFMLSKGCVPNIITYTALIDGYCKGGDIEKSCQIYARMKADIMIPDVDVYFKSEDGDSKKPNVFTYGALIDGLCKARRVKDAHELLNIMSVEGCEPNDVVYDALVDGFCKIGKLDEAEDVFTKMLQSGYKPNVYTYGSLINIFFRDKRLDLAVKVLFKMLENSCAPNVVIYTELIDGLCKVGKTDEAYRIMMVMEERNCAPNVITYTAMIDGYGKAGRVDKALDMLQQMGSKGCAPNLVTYLVLINHCCACGNLDEADVILEEMRQTYWPSHGGLRRVIEGYNNDFIASLGLLTDMADDSVPVSPFYRVLINNFSKAGRLEKALELYEELLSSSPLSDNSLEICFSLIESLSLACKVDKAFELFGFVVNNGRVPMFSVLVLLIKALLWANMWEEALQLSHSICEMDINWLQKEDVSNAS